MKVLNFSSTKDHPYSECNNPEAFYRLSKRKQAALVDWIQTELKQYEIQSYNLLSSSYSLKHLFTNDGGFYVTNGEFKGAALEAGLIPKNYNWTNWTFKLSTKISR